MLKLVKFIPALMKVFLWSMVALVAAGAVVASLLLLKPFAGSNSSNRPDKGSHDQVQAAKSGKQTYHLTVDGVEREFIVYRPSNVAKNAATPVVFMFHGTNQSGEQFYKISGWKEEADEQGITVVFPTALKYHLIDDKESPSGEVVTASAQLYVTKWTHYKIDDMLDPAYPEQKVHDDVDFTQAMVDFVKDNYSVDVDRFYATGFSNGAQFTSRLAVEMSDTFAAFATGGTGNISYDDIQHMNDHTDTPFVPRPMITSVGSKDPKVLRSLGLAEIPNDDSLMADDSKLKLAVVNPFLKLEGLSDDYTYSSKGKVAGYTFNQTLAGGESATEYNLLIVDEMGHLYANGKNDSVTYTNIFWPFFERYSL